MCLPKINSNSSEVIVIPRKQWGPANCFFISPSQQTKSVGKFLSGQFGIQVVEILFRNFTLGYLADILVIYWLIRAHRGIPCLYKCNTTQIPSPALFTSLTQSWAEISPGKKLDYYLQQIIRMQKPTGKSSKKYNFQIDAL